MEIYGRLSAANVFFAANVAFREKATYRMRFSRETKSGFAALTTAANVMDIRSFAALTKFLERGAI